MAEKLLITYPHVIDYIVCEIWMKKKCHVSLYLCTPCILQNLPDQTSTASISTTTKKPCIHIHEKADLL